MLEHRPSQELEMQENTIDEITLSVAKLCLDFPGKYWRELDTKQEYPTQFVQALTESGFLGVLIPEEYGGSGLGIVAASKILEEIHHQGCNAAACHTNVYNGNCFKARSVEQKNVFA